MGKQRFAKEKVQVEWETKLSFTEDAKTLKPYKDDADKLIKLIEAADDEWGFDFAIKVDAKKDTVKVERVKSITYPQLRNGHQGESGHDWQWQLDTESAGAGSKIRLYLDDVSASITKQAQEDNTVKVGRDDYKVVTCKVTVTGKFSAGQKH